MCLVFTQVASMVGLWVGLALIILFSEVIRLDIFDHRASSGSADRDNETASPAPHTLGGRDRNRHLLVSCRRTTCLLATCGPTRHRNRQPSPSVVVRPLKLPPLQYRSWVDSSARSPHRPTAMTNQWGSRFCTLSYIAEALEQVAEDRRWERNRRAESRNKSR